MVKIYVAYNVARVKKGQIKRKLAEQSRPGLHAHRGNPWCIVALQDKLIVTSQPATATSDHLLERVEDLLPLREVLEQQRECPRDKGRVLMHDEVQQHAQHLTPVLAVKVQLTLTLVAATRHNAMH